MAATIQNPCRCTAYKDSALPHMSKASAVVRGFLHSQRLPPVPGNWSSIQTWMVISDSFTLLHIRQLKCAMSQTHTSNEQRHELSRCVQRPVNGTFTTSWHTLFFQRVFAAYAHVISLKPHISPGNKSFTPHLLLKSRKRQCHKEAELRSHANQYFSHKGVSDDQISRSTNFLNGYPSIDLKLHLFHVIGHPSWCPCEEHRIYRSWTFLSAMWVLKIELKSAGKSLNSVSFLASPLSLNSVIAWSLLSGSKVRCPTPCRVHLCCILYEDIGRSWLTYRALTGPKTKHLS